jgi:hypothetical protein
MSGVGVERLLKLPPRIKVLEASGAIADGRVRIVRKRNGTVIAKVSSSTGDREYTVIVKRANGEIFRVYSDDNGTRYRNYVGYPIIAILMLEGILPRRPDIEEALAGVPWKRWNEEFKKYTIVEARAASKAESEGIPRDELREFVGNVMSSLSRLKLIYDPSLLEKLKVWM